jgi:ABC-type glycerol-3-phosphate transport system substrate-binding protein
MVPLGAKATDLVVWWEKGLYAQEDEAVAETIAAFEQETGKQVELTHFPLLELPGRVEAALKAGQPPDFAFGLLLYSHVAQWAFDDRLVSLSDAIGHFSDLFDSDAIDWVTLFNANTGQKALYGLPVGRSSDHIFV